MRNLKRNLTSLGWLFLFSLFCALSPAQEPECVDPPPANAPVDADMQTYCVDHPEFLCDLAIANWDEITYQSADIRIGDPLTTAGAEEPRFFFDSVGNRFYTKLYVKFINNGVGPACAGTNASVDPKVTFSFKESGNPADIDNNSIPWQEVNSDPAKRYYMMNIPLPGNYGYGALFAGGTHYQQKGVCWTFSAGDMDIPMQFIIKAEISWGADEDSTNNVAYSLYDLSEVDHLAHIGFAIDLSGSMDTFVPGVGNKLAVARLKAALFTNLIEDDDYLGVYGFATGNPANTNFTTTYTDTSSNPYTATLQQTSVISAMHEISGDLDRIGVMLAIGAQTAHGCTPVGQGLLRSRAGLKSIPPDPTASKAIVLFSDGLQNVKPFVNSSPPYTCLGYPSYNTISALGTFAAENIPIYTVYFGEEVGWGYSFMQQLKNQTGGKYVYATATELELAAAYFAIRGLVDDMIYLKEDGVTTVQAPWPTFEVNFDEAVDLATVAVTWPYGNGETKLTIDRRKKGEEEWTSSAGPAPGTPATPSFEVSRFAPGTSSTWEFRVRQLEPQNGKTEYAAAVFSDVIQGQIMPSLNDKDFQVGMPLAISTSLRAAGLPLRGATVTAVVKKPARSFSSTLRKYFKKFPPGSDPDTSRVTRIIPSLKKLLLEDVGSDKLYVYNELEVKLEDNGTGADKVKDDGIYTGVLSGDQTHIPGDYEVRFAATGTLPSGQTFQRFAKLGTICNVGPMDPGKSVVEMSTSDPDKDGNRLVKIIVLPSDRFGNAPFPGSDPKIGISSVGGGTLKGSLEDNLDSSFVQQLVLRPGEDATVKVAVDGALVGTYSTAEPLLRHELSIHLGAAIPEGTFGDEASSGISFGPDYTYRLNRNFGIRSELAFNLFNDSSDGNMTLTNFTSYLQYRYLTGKIAPYFESGLGIYNLEDGDTGFGYSAGIGIQYVISKRLSLDLSFHGHRSGGDLDLSFFQVYAGSIFKF